ncbi:hypothetical protein EG68_09009 [Paragonimus skrjabini miyazakii]|uniref:Uncharacterized protein n=1 Tax=Paragonimus skrjabini miyazakii TaxID=59628 RepID=A0A8S9YFI5_9TREM|nr:hypothetical protein EG68_09009 [Paragonimus skrjabini miyazakii]
MIAKQSNAVSPTCVVPTEECVGKTREKWLCPPGYHPQEFFQCAVRTTQIDETDKSNERIRWTENLSRVKNPMDRFRPWAHDHSGLRLLDWNTSKVDCQPAKVGNFDYLPVCMERPSPLTRYFNVLDNLKETHPRQLLERYVYRDPDEYLLKQDVDKVACTPGCDARPFTELRSMHQREIMRLRFVTNNYRTFDDWKEDPTDELLAKLAKPSSR